MAKSDTFIRLGLVGYTDCSAWISAGVLECFAIANVAARICGASVRFDCATIAAAGSSVRASHGVRLTIAKARARVPYSAIVVPPMWSSSREDFVKRLTMTRTTLPLLQQLASRAQIMASACSGGALLAEAGLLDGYRATTCWWLADWFEPRYPAVELDARQLVIADRDRWTAGAGTAYLHLCLELIRKFAGRDVAATTGRLALVEPRRGSQSPFLGRALEVVDPHAPKPVRRAFVALQRRPNSSEAIATLAKRYGTTERTLNRQFRSTIGTTPLAFRQSQRIALAKRLLESGNAPLETVVERCGYTDTASFRKLFAREVGMSPREYRLRFGR